MRTQVGLICIMLSVLGMGCSAIRQEHPAQRVIRDRLAQAGIECRYLHEDASGTFCLDLRGPQVTNLAGLAGLPVSDLTLWGTCVTDLSPLHKLPLHKLRIIDSKRITSLEPLRGLNLTSLLVCNTRVTDLSPLKGMPLSSFSAPNTDIKDLTPLRGMALTTIAVGGTGVTDLSPLQGMKLKELNVYSSQVCDLSPVQGMPLEMVELRHCPNIRDLTPLAGAPLQWLNFSQNYITNGIDVLRDINTLKLMNNMWSNEFWEKHAKGALPVEKTPTNITYEGGDGSSIANAIIIKGAPTADIGVRAEEIWIRLNHPGWQEQKQALLSASGKQFDRTDYKDPQGKTQTIYFDITDFFGKF